MRSAGYGTWSVCLSVCPFPFSATRRNKIAKRVWRYICLIVKLAIFVKNTAFKSYGVKTK